MPKLKYQQNEIPLQSPIVTKQGMLADSWNSFFQRVFKATESAGIEKTCPLENGKTTIVDDPDRDNIIGLAVSAKVTSFAAVDYLIQRRTVDTGATEKTEAGTFYLAYKPGASPTWVLTGGPTATSGITLSVTSDGQVQYVSTAITGVETSPNSISRMVWKARTMAAKHASYSAVGGVG